MRSRHDVTMQKIADIEAEIAIRPITPESLTVTRKVSKGKNGLTIIRIWRTLDEAKRAE